MLWLRYASWALVALFTLAIGTLLYFGSQPQVQRGETLAFGGPFSLINSYGEPFTHHDLAGRPYAIFFGFTHCPDVCPTTLVEMAAWISEIGDAADEMQFVFVTVDPERDTPDILSRYIAAFDERIIGLTGSTSAIEEVIGHYKIYAKQVPLEQGGYTMDHTASVILIDENGDFFATIAYGESHETAIDKLKRLANAS